MDTRRAAEGQPDAAAAWSLPPSLLAGGLLAVVAAVELLELLLGRGTPWDAAVLALATLGIVALGWGARRPAEGGTSPVGDRPLRVDNVRARMLANAGHEALLLHRGGEIVDVNDAVVELTKIPRDELLELQVVDLVAMESRDDIITWLHASTVPDLQVRGRRRDGDEFELELTRRGGVREGMWVLVLADVQEQQGFARELTDAREAAENASRAKSSFLASMSHEVRTPMNAVIGMADLLLNTELTSEQRELAETIRTSSDALLVILNDILDFSKIESGKLELTHKPFDLIRCIDGVIQLFAHRSQDDVELLYSVGESVPPGIVGDSARLRQVLVNLVGNALKFTESGEVQIRVESRLDDALHFIHFEVHDTGIGISKSRVDDLFESFVQGDSSINRKYGGTGLGLTISRRLVELMGGSIWVDSTEGEGSTFHFVISARATGLLAPESTPLEGRRALVVEPRPSARDYLMELLQREGMDVCGVDTPAAACAWLMAHQADVVVFSERAEAELPPREQAAMFDAVQAKAVPLLMLMPRGDTRIGGPVPGVAASLARPTYATALRGALVEVMGMTRSAASTSGTRYIDLASEHPLDILLADDNPVNVKVTLGMLRRLGYTADAVYDGTEVLTALGRKPYDVILMDVQMPQMGGLEASRRIREQFPDDEQPRIVALTASAMESDRQACLDAGMNDYLSKPMRANMLIDVLRRSPARSG